MSREGESFKDYSCRRADDVARVIKKVMNGNFDVEIEIEDQDDEYEAQIETLVLGFNMMCGELKRLDDIAKNELERAKEYIRQQQSTIAELSTPVIEIWDDILVLPVVGVVDTMRSVEIMNNLLQSIVASQARCVIVDITGVDVVDTKTADHLLKVVRAARLLGTRCVLTGLNPAVAQTLVEIGADLTEVLTLRNLKAGLKDCILYLRSGRQSPVDVGDNPTVR